MTHINAFYQEVQEKEEAVKQAKAELEGAKLRLESHPDYVKPTSKPTVTKKVTSARKKR